MSQPQVRIQLSDQPSRYSCPRNFSASGALEMRRFFASHSIFLPARKATFPRELRVILAPQSAPHRTRALAMLCQELNRLETRFPGSDLRLNFSVREDENVS